MVSEPFGVHHHAQLPHQPGHGGHGDQGAGIKSTHEDQGGEHHQVIPVEDPAGGAAAVFQDQAEGTPDQDADQIAHIEEHGDHEQVGLVQHAGVVQHPDGRD